MVRGAVWIGVGLLIAFPTYYFFSHIADASFRDGAIGNWFGTVMGIIVGVPVALWLAQEQRKMEARTEAKEQVELREERLRSISHRVQEELRHNSTLVEYLSGVFTKSESARLDLWTWAEKIVGGMEFEAFGELDGTLVPEERGQYSELLASYRDLRRLSTKVRESTAAHSFLLGYSGNQTEADRLFDETRSHLDITKTKISTAIETIAATKLS